MEFDLLWIDFYWTNRLFGFGFCGIRIENKSRNLFSIYWNDRELMIDLFWFRIVTHIVLIGWPANDLKEKTYEKSKN